MCPTCAAANRTLRTEQVPPPLWEERQPNMWMWTWSRNCGTFSPGMSKILRTKKRTAETRRLGKNENENPTRRHENPETHNGIHQGYEKNRNVEHAVTQDSMKDKTAKERGKTEQISIKYRHSS